MTDEPRWEKGHRAHAYIAGTKRLGRVSLPPSGFSAADYGYSAWIDEPFTLLPRAATLPEAKRAVEEAVAARRRGARKRASDS